MTLAHPLRRRLAAPIAAVALAWLAACGGDKPVPAEAPQPAEHHEDNGLALSADEAQRAGIKTEAMALQAVAKAITVTATIRVNQDRIARVAPRVEGRVIQVAAKLGDSVKAGQRLATLDSLALGEAQSALQQAQSGQRIAQADFERAEALSAEEIIPRREYLRARADLEKASAELLGAQDRVRLLGGTAGTGRASASFGVTAPLGGTVIQKQATVGELATPAEPLFTVADLSTVWIEANLTEDMLASVHKGAAATVTVKAFADQRFEGRVTYVASLLDKESRTAAARIEVANPDGRLKPEMFASATIETGGTRPQALSVPDAAILLLQGQPTVFVAGHGGYEPRAIETGEQLGGRTVVTSGLAEGEQVVTSGAYALKARLLKSQIGDSH